MPTGIYIRTAKHKQAITDGIKDAYQNGTRSSWNAGLTKETHPSLAQASKKMVGHTPPNKGKTFPYKPHPGQQGRKITLEERIRHSAGALGIPVSEWAGFKRSELYRLRRSPEYREWRDAVYKRDNFTCQECGAHGVKLEADHIKSFALFPELRFDVGNGRTLCVPCHKTATIEFLKKYRAIRDQLRNTY